MDYRRFGGHIVLRIDRGEEVVEKITELAEKENIKLGAISGLGAADHVVMGVYDIEEQVFHKQEMNELMEITSLIGNITEMDGKPYLHIHINLADKNGNVHGGHLNEVRSGGTAEIVVTVIEGAVGRKKDQITGTGLNLFEF